MFILVLFGGLEINRPPVWKMVREAVESLGSASRREIIDYIKGRYGDVNERTIQAHITLCAVNHPSRIHYPPNRRPRDCSELANRYDILFRRDDGKYELYDPNKHGRWLIEEKNGKFQVVGPSGIAEPKSRSHRPLGPIEPGFSDRMRIRNPLLRTALYSLMNALEFFLKGEERHRQAALIFMDQAVEYVLKAALYEHDRARFLESFLERLGYEDSIKEVEKIGITISREEKIELKRVHGARNYAQHRAVIPDSNWTREYMEWVYNFMKRFCQDNFNINIDNLIPQHMRNKI